VNRQQAQRYGGKASLIVLAVFIVFAAGMRNMASSAQAPKANARGGQNSMAAVSITGLVRQPLQLGLRDLKAFGSVSVRRVDHRSDGYFGDFEFRGVPLTTLISVDRCNGKPPEDEGFKVVVANDTIAERWVKSLASINIVRAASR
jgi:DMSO/TMAO reductase YedYZ molybdopterin-dependent catalytic subunit